MRTTFGREDPNAYRIGHDLGADPRNLWRAARIDGTRMTVNQIVTLHKQGLTALQIVETYPQRTPSEIYTVLAWYHAHQAEFDQELAQEAVGEERDRLEYL